MCVHDFICDFIYTFEKILDKRILAKKTLFVNISKKKKIFFVLIRMIYV